MIKIQNLKKSFSGIQALDIEALEIYPGECVGVVGNNGAGKTTFFKSVLDLLKPDDGYVSVEDVPVNISADWQNHLNAFIDESFLIEFLRPKEYLSFILKMKNSQFDVEKLLSDYAEFSNKDIDENKKYIRDLSTGTKVRIGVLSLLAGDPKYIIMDEPFAHLDPTSQAKLRKLIRAQKEKGRCVIVSSHNLQNIAESCDRVILIERGQVKYDVEVNEENMKKLGAYFDN
ncbi:ABC transporter ATP-binding protein [Ekhidna sp.]|jgi:ABC-2 type transport system ATP-binding protein|uniref:ABC transporter ATP-binding protein n=1 Tax=Ekhidna sp. TaxID=2608089 RepID=UPI0032EB1B0E